jgi:transposase-like protein
MTHAHSSPARKERAIINKLSWEEKVELCNRWQESGIGRRAFCKQHGVAFATFYGWCNKIWPRSTKKKRSPLSPVRIVNTTNETHEEGQLILELSFPNQAMARIKLPLSSMGKLIQELCYAATIIR